jgi:hypothetical protein
MVTALALSAVLVVGYECRAPDPPPVAVAAPAPTQPAPPVETSVEQLRKDAADLSAKLDARRTDLQAAQHSSIRFLFNGTVNDIDGDTILVFGRATPLDQNLNHPGSIIQPASLIVRHVNSRKQGRTIAVGYPFTGQAYFQRRTTGKNAVGGEVPVWEYDCDPPAALAAIRADIDRMEKELTALQAKVGDDHGRPNGEAPTSPTTLPAATPETFRTR